MSRNLLGVTVAVAVLVIAMGGGIAVAGESGTLKGTGGGTGPTPSITLGNGDTITLLHPKQVLTVETPDGLVFQPGECVGMVVTKADGTYIGGEGYCTWKESENDTWDIRFKETGPQGGTFEITGGKGRWKDVRATGGTYTYTYNDGGQFRYTYSIDYTIP